MSEQQSEHETYLNRARNMSFGDLRRYIDEALKRSSNAGPDAEVPSSKQDFLDLWQILYEKGYPPRQEAPPPPVYEGPLPYLGGISDLLTNSFPCAKGTIGSWTFLTRHWPTLRPASTSAS